MRGQQRAGGGGGVLAAAVGMEDGVLADHAGVERAAQGAGDDVGVEGVGEFPAEDGAAEEVDDDGQVEPAFASGDAGNRAERDSLPQAARRAVPEGAGKCR